jgi:hypothetical protein
MSEEVIEQVQETEQSAPVETAQEEQSFTPSTIASLFGGEKVEEPVKDTEQTQAATDQEPAPEPEPIKAEEPVLDAKAIAKERDGMRAAMLEERRKRQEYEARLAAVEQAKNAPPEGLYIDEEVKKFYEQDQTRRAAEYQKQMIAATTELAREVYKDYDQVVAVFAERAETDQALLSEVLAAKNPAKAAYDKGKRFMIEKQYGTDDPVVLEKKIEETLRAKLEKEIRDELMGKAVAKSKQPTRLTKLASSGGSQESDWKPTSVSSLFGKR